MIHGVRKKLLEVRDQQVALGLLDFVQLAFIGHGLDALLGGENVFVAGHHHDRLELDVAHPEFLKECECQISL